MAPAWQADSIPLSHLGSPNICIDDLKTFHLKMGIFLQLRVKFFSVISHQCFTSVCLAFSSWKSHFIYLKQVLSHRHRIQAKWAI